MANGLTRAVAAPTTVELDGKTYIMEPLTLKDMGTLESEYLKDKPNPIKAVAEMRELLDQEDYDKLLAQAYKDATAVNKATSQEIADWMDSSQGVIFSVWLSLRKNHPELTREDAEKVINKMGQQELEKLAEQRDVTSGLDELGNSTGRSTGPEKEKASKTSSNGATVKTKGKRARAQNRRH